MRKWIQDAVKRHGALRKKLGAKKGHNLTEKQIESAEHSKNPTTRKQAYLAETFRKMRRKGKS